MHIEIHTSEINSELLELLLIADPNEKLVNDYISKSTILIARKDSLLVGVAVLIKNTDGFELKNISVKEGYQNKGIGKKLINEIKLLAKNMGAKELIVGTANSSITQILFYQKCGFRMDHIRKNYFLDYPVEIVENGIKCLDLVVLKIDLDFF